MQTTIEARFLGFYPLSRLCAHERHPNPVYTRKPFWPLNPSAFGLSRVLEPVVLEPNYTIRFIPYYPVVDSILKKETLGQVIMLVNLGLEPEFARNQDARNALTIAELTATRPITTFQQIMVAKHPWPEIVGSNRPFRVRSRNGTVHGFSFRDWHTAQWLLSSRRWAPWIVRLSGLKLQSVDYLSLIAPLKPNPPSPI